MYNRKNTPLLVYKKEYISSHLLTFNAEEHFLYYQLPRYSTFLIPL